ncbi:MAG: site-specific integrase [Actinobacteria bacterium]|nr:site-specific integrase [Actinomycetota bacterium]
MASIFRRGKTYWARAQRKRRELRVSLQTTDRTTAERRFREWLGELEAVAWGDKPRRSYAEAEERFINEHLPAIKPGAARRYGVSLKHLSEHFGNMMLHEITSAGLSDFETKRRAHGVSTSTIRRDFACLSSMLTSAQDWEWTTDNANPVPAYLRRRAKRGLKEGAPHTRYLTEAEEAKVIAHASPDVAKAMAVAIDTGLRLEELFSLEWSQVDLVRGLITTTTNTKSGRKRKVPVSARAGTILGTLPRHLHCPHVFVNPDTKERFGQMTKGFKAAVRRAKVDKATWHDLRRTAGCRWLQRDGKSMEEVSILLGHSSVTVTEKSYAFLEAEDVAASLSGAQKAGTWNGGHHTDFKGETMTSPVGPLNSDSVDLGSNPGSPATQSGLSLTFPRHQGISTVPRYFAGPDPVSANDCGRFNRRRGRHLHRPILTNGLPDQAIPEWPIGGVLGPETQLGKLDVPPLFQELSCKTGALHPQSDQELSDALQNGAEANCRSSAREEVQRHPN